MSSPPWVPREIHFCRDFSAFEARGRGRGVGGSACGDGTSAAHPGAFEPPSLRRPAALAALLLPGGLLHFSFFLGVRVPLLNSTNKTGVSFFDHGHWASEGVNVR